MLKTFNKEYFLNHRGCYPERRMEKLVDNNPHSTIEDFLKWNISPKDKCSFIIHYCNLTDLELRKFAIMCAKKVAPIYNKKYPNDEIINSCIKASEDYFINKSISLKELQDKRNDAYIAYSDTADAFAYVAYAAACDVVFYAAFNAAFNAAFSGAYTKLLLEMLKEFCKEKI